MENPYKRLRKLTKTSQKDFADKHQFAGTTMTYIESGQYPDLSDDMIVALGQECHDKNVDATQVLKDEYNEQTLQDAYHAWQSLERMQVAHKFQAPPPEHFTEQLSPFHFFMLSVAPSQQAFCKLLKVPAATVGRYATGYTRTMPKVLTRALKEVKYPYLQELLTLQVNWTDEHA